MITFFKKKDEHEWMSNFAQIGLEIDGKTYPTAEHAFQAAKFTEHAPEYAEEIRQAATPASAKAKGKSRKHKINSQWDQTRVETMRRILRAKIAANPELADRLRATGNEELGEANPFDYFWGLGKSGKGKNWMGRLWMELRSEII